VVDMPLLVVDRLLLVVGMLLLENRFRYHCLNKYYIIINKNNKEIMIIIKMKLKSNNIYFLVYINIILY